MAQENNNILKKIMPYWPFILLVGAIVFQMAQAQMKNNYQDEKLELLTGQQATVAENINEIKNNITEIKAIIGKWDGFQPKK